MLYAKSRKYRGAFKYVKYDRTDALSLWSISKSQKGGTESRVRKGKRSLLASNIRCKCSMETTRNRVNVKSGIKVMEIC